MRVAVGYSNIFMMIAGHPSIRPERYRVLPKNARYLRLKTLSVGYTFSNSKRLASVGIKKLGISLTGYNLLTFTPLDFADPESLTDNNGAYPLVKVYSVGLNVTF